MSPRANGDRYVFAGNRNLHRGFHRVPRWRSQFTHKMFLYLPSPLMLGRSNLAMGRSLMHGVAPHMCWSSSPSIVRRRCRGSLPRHTLIPTFDFIDHFAGEGVCPPEVRNRGSVFVRELGHRPVMRADDDSVVRVKSGSIRPRVHPKIASKIRDFRPQLWQPMSLLLCAIHEPAVAVNRHASRKGLPKGTLTGGQKATSGPQAPARSSPWLNPASSPSFDEKSKIRTTENRVGRCVAYVRPWPISRPNRDAGRGR
jgi:hypothetical protein